MKEQLSEAGYRSNLEYFRNLEIKALRESTKYSKTQVDLYDEIKKNGYNLFEITNKINLL